MPSATLVILSTSRLPIAVAILAILRSESGAFAPSTIIIEQFRPPIDRCVVGMSPNGFLVSLVYNDSCDVQSFPQVS